MQQSRIKLAETQEIALGSLRIVPRLREIHGADGSVIRIEPRVMQVLVALARSPGETMSRDQLVEVCWQNVVVSDDAVNRVISLLRRHLEGQFSELVEIETITKVGYRLVVKDDDDGTTKSVPGFTRRGLAIGLGGTGLLSLALGAVAWWRREPGQVDLQIAHFTVEAENDRMLAEGMRHNLASRLRMTGLVRVLSLYGPLGDTKVVASARVKTLQTRLRRNGSSVILTFELEGLAASPFEISGPANEIAIVESHFVEAVFKSLLPNASRAGFASPAAGRDYESYLFATGLLRSRVVDKMRTAREMLERIVARNPNWVEAKVALAHALYLTRIVGSRPETLGRVAPEAYDLAKEAVAARPDYGAAHAVLGLTSPNRAEALELFEKATQLDPFDAERWIELGVAKNALMDFEGSFRAFLEAWKLEPFWIRTQDVGAMAAQFGRHSQGDAIDTAIAQGHPDPAMAGLAKARLALRRGNLREALRNSEAAHWTPQNQHERDTLYYVELLRTWLELPPFALTDPDETPIHLSLARGQLPRRQTMEAQRITVENFWTFGFIPIVSVPLFVKTGRGAELLRLFDDSFANVRSMVSQLTSADFGGAEKIFNTGPYIALALRDAGRNEEAAQVLAVGMRLLSRAKTKGILPDSVLVAHARLEALSDNPAAALRLLRDARGRGWPTNWIDPLIIVQGSLSDDPAFAALYDTPEFLAIDREVAALSSRGINARFPGANH